MKNVGLLGHFAFNEKKNDGQTVKTRELYYELSRYKNLNVNTLDTFNYNENIMLFLRNCINLIKENEYIVIVVASGGLKILIPLFALLNIIYRKKVSYCAVGSWLDVRVKNNPLLKISCKKMNKIFVETFDLKNTLNKMGFKNVEIMYNFKKIHKSNDVFKREDNSFCIFSRVIKEKGIADAARCIRLLNEEGYKTKLYIYGAIGDNYLSEFNKMLQENSDSIYYMGCVDSSDSRKIISKYWILLFPTRFIKEGLPGTLIDAYNSETPVISSNWISAPEFVPASVGFTYQFLNVDDMYRVMKYCLTHKKEVERKRKNTKKFAEKFDPENAILPLLKFLEV